LLSFKFREFPAVTAVNILEAASPSSSSPSATDQQKAMTPSEARATFSPFDLKRIIAYTNNMLDYHVILDLLPSLAGMYFDDRIPPGPEGPVRLSAVQSAILCAVGLQRKQVEDVEVCNIFLDSLTRLRSAMLMLLFCLFKKVRT
jgi:N-acetyltransferase 10